MRVQWSSAVPHWSLAAKLPSRSHQFENVYTLFCYDIKKSLADVKETVTFQATPTLRP